MTGHVLVAGDPSIFLLTGLRVDSFEIRVVVRVVRAVFAQPTSVIFVMQSIQNTNDVLPYPLKNWALRSFSSHVGKEMTPKNQQRLNATSSDCFGW